MSRLSIARLLLLALLGLTLALAAVAAIGVAGLYDARQDYEDGLARTYAGEVAAANLLATGLVEETILRSERGGARSRTRAQAAFDRAAQLARDASASDERALGMVARAVTSEQAVRVAAGDLRGLGRRPSRAREEALDRLAAALGRGRSAAVDLARRHGELRAAARDRVEDRTRRAVITAGVAGALALLGALALVAALVARMRGPLERLVGATRRLAGGDLEARVDPEGPAELRQLSAAFNSMAGDLEVAGARIEAGRRRLASVIESLGDALVICDGHGRVTQVNPRTEVLLPEITPGRSLARDPGPMPPLEEVIDGESEIAHGGRTLSVTAARMGPGLDDGVVFTIRDISERARLERAKSDFVATASHELRSPLTSIKGFVELLGSSPLADRQREFVEIIALSTNRLVDLVNDLLDVARVEAGQLEIQRRPIAIGEAVGEVAALMAPRFDEKRQRLDVEIAPALPIAHADPARVRQIVMNLLTNAHLYTPEGGSVAVSLGATDDHVCLAVSDTGRGMTPVQLERVFERFFRAEGQTTAGTGLGLSIVKSLVELHDGNVEVESQPGEGTTVTVRIPRAPAARDLVEPRQALHGRRVLVVDDEPEVARLIAAQLEPFEVDVTIVHDGESALRALRSETFDAVTLDILLGGMDGFEVLKEVREDPALRRTPVIVVSVLAGQDALAAEWSVTKPIDADELSDAIGAAILAGRARVLVVGRATMRPVVGPLLDRRGIDHAWATSGAEAARMCEETRFEVALVDAGMRAPQAALAQLDLRGRRLRRSVVIFSAGDEAPGLARLDPDPVPVEDATQAVVDALRAGAVGGDRPLGFAPGARVPIDHITERELRAELERRERENADLRAELERHQQEVSASSRQLERYAADLRETFKEERRRSHELKRSYRATVRALANAVEARDAYTGRHAERVAAYGLEIAAEAGLDIAGEPEIEFGFLLHDVGKVAVPDAILFKATRLTDEEYALIAKHPETGWEILRDIDFLGDAKLVVRHHHERWDGSGYPDGLAGEAIPLSARVFAVADTLDALTTDRPYRSASPIEAARAVIRAASGSQFDPGVIEAFDRIPDARFAELRDRIG